MNEIEPSREPGRLILVDSATGMNTLGYDASAVIIAMAFRLSSSCMS